MPRLPHGLLALGLGILGPAGCGPKSPPQAAAPSQAFTMLFPSPRVLQGRIVAIRPLVTAQRALAALDLPDQPAPTVQLAVSKPAAPAAPRMEFILKAEGHVFSVVQPNSGNWQPGQKVSIIRSDHTVLAPRA